MLVVPGAVTPMSIAILTLAIVITIVVTAIVASALGTDDASGRKNQQCSHGTIFGNSMQRIH
jgi:hypothetical protein